MKKLTELKELHLELKELKERGGEKNTAGRLDIVI